MNMLLFFSNSDFRFCECNCEFYFRCLVDTATKWSQTEPGISAVPQRTSGFLGQRKRQILRICTALFWIAKGH